MEGSGGQRKRFEVFTIRDNQKEGAERKAFWIKIGVSFVNKDGSFNVYLDALPIDGKLQIREYREEDRAPANGGARGEQAAEQLDARRGRNGKSSGAETPF